MIPTWVVLAGVGLLLLFAVDYLATNLVRPMPRRPERPVSDLGRPIEEIKIHSHGHELGAWVVRPADGVEVQETVLVLAHGWGANHGPLLGLAAPLLDAGYELLIFDVRGHGNNEAVPYATVRHFRDDLLSVGAWTRERFPGRPMVAIGHSLGGAAAVLSAAEGMPWDALVLIAAPHDVRVVTAEFLTDAKGLPGDLLVRLCTPFWWRRVGGTFGPLTPSRRIKELAQPLLIIQPEHDRRVGLHHARALSESAGVPYRLIGGAEHTNVLEHPETAHTVLEFLNGVRAGSTGRAAD